MDRATTETEWAQHSARYLKAELKRHDVTYEILADRLKGVGFQAETKASIANKLARGTFSAPFFLAALVAVGCTAVRLDDV